MSGLLKVRLIVLNYNGAEILSRCLPSLVEATARSSRPAQLTLLDNGSTDGSVGWARGRFPELSVVITPQNRLLFSFNDYVKTLDEDIVILMNNDIRVETDFMEPLVRVFEEQPDAFLAAPQTFSFDGSRYEGGRTRARIRWGLFWSSAFFPGWEALQQKPGWTFASGFGAFHRSRFLELGAYDDLYFPGIMEDADLGFRAWRQGYRSYYVPTSRVYHFGQASFKKAFGEKGIQILAHRNSFLFIWKNISDFSFLMEHFIFLSPRLLWAIVSGKPELVFGFLKAVARAGEAIKRRSFPEKRSRTDREIFAQANEEVPRRRYLFLKKWKRILVGIFDVVGRAVFFSKRNHEAVPEKILVIRLDSMGDGVLTLPAIQALKRRYPKARIDFLVSPAVRDLFHYFFPESETQTAGTSAAMLREKRYDLAIDFRGDLRTILRMAASGIRRRWGRGGAGGGFLLERERNPSFEQHEVRANLAVVEDAPESVVVEFPKLRHPWSGKLQGKKQIVIHAGAGYPSKRWAPERFVEVARQIGQRKWGIPIFIGGAEEQKSLDPYWSRLDVEFKDLMGQTSFEELMQVIAECDLFLGNDSGPAHLAALSGRKLVVVFSGTNNWRQWAPWSNRLRVVHHPVPCAPCEETICPLQRQHCLEEITVEEVLRAVEDMLAR